MKDATGELSMTAVAVVAIAAISVVFTTLIWPSIKKNIVRSAHCNEAVRCDCPSADDPKSYCTCYYLDDNNEPQEVKCPNQTVTGIK